MPEISFEMSINVDVECAKCGQNLDGTLFGRGETTIFVKPCSVCMDERYEQGVAAGKGEDY